MRTLILLYSYKALPKSEAPAEHFAGLPLALSQETYYGNAIGGDCYTMIARRWLEAGFVNAVKAIAIQYPKGHARYSPAGVMQIDKDYNFYILEDISQYASVHQPSSTDILFIRGHPPWEPIIERHPTSFKLFYSGGADLGQWLPRYPVNVILVDDPTLSTHNARCIELLKCCDEETFHPMGLEKVYDICFISRVERGDKKGQLEFARLANKQWRAIFVGEIADSELAWQLQEIWPSCEIAGHKTKSEVNVILNRSKVSIVYTRENEGGIRVITESLASGTPVIINKRNIGRKYITPQAGEVAASWCFRWKVSSALRNLNRYQPRRAYEKHFHSRKVAIDLWKQLGFP